MRRSPGRLPLHGQPELKTRGVDQHAIQDQLSFKKRGKLQICHQVWDIYQGIVFGTDLQFLQIEDDAVFKGQFAGADPYRMTQALAQIFLEALTVRIQIDLLEQEDQDHKAENGKGNEQIG